MAVGGRAGGQAPRPHAASVGACGTRREERANARRRCSLSRTGPGCRQRPARRPCRHRVWVAFLPKAPGSTREERAVSPACGSASARPPRKLGCNGGTPQGAQAFLPAGLWLLLYFPGFICHFTPDTETPRELQLWAQVQLLPSSGRGGAGPGPPHQGSLWGSRDPLRPCQTSLSARLCAPVSPMQQFHSLPFDLGGLGCSVYWKVGLRR